jgi:hypothetical protein
MNFFSSDPFLEALAASQFPGKRCMGEEYQVEGHRFRLPSVNGRPLLQWPFLDFFEPRTAEELSGAPARALRYLPYASLDIIALQVERPAKLPSGHQFSPLVDWRQFSSWDGFLAHVATRRSNLMADSQRRERKLAAALGPLTFAYHDSAEEAFDKCREWKSGQYLATGGTDSFFQRSLPLFRELLRRKVLVVSTLRAGGALLAVNWSAEWQGRLYHWVPAYDPAHSAASPGRLLLHYLLKESHQRGHREFDMLIGDEGYKWFYATHSRIIRPLGRAPLRLTAERALKASVKRALAGHPQVLEAARKLKKRLAR